MIQKVRYVGLDVHADSVVVAVAEPGDAPAVEFAKQAYDMPRLLGTLKRLGRVSSLKVCYEAGPTGLGLQRFLRKHGVECVVVAPARCR